MANLKLANDVCGRSNSMEAPEIIDNSSDRSETEKDKKKAVVTFKRDRIKGIE